MGAAAGGGGGGGGGGGATRNVINCCFGRASVKTKGMMTRTPISITWKIKETSVVAPRFVLSLPPDSIRLSSNISFSLRRPLRMLRHRLTRSCSQSRQRERLFQLATNSSKQAR